MINRRELLGESSATVAAMTALASSRSLLAAERTGTLPPRPPGDVPGVRSIAAYVRSAEEAAQRAVALARQSATQQSFGVGGFLMDNTGRVLAEATNSVIRNGQLSDPTAHVERQLVDWHARAFPKRISVPASELTIVSSLDPCAMCAGAIMRSNMHVIAVAEDNQAGVHKGLEPVHMPSELQAAAQQRMAFFGIRGGRPQTGGIAISMFRQPISDNLAGEAQSILLESLDKVRGMVGGSEQNRSAAEQSNAGAFVRLGPIIKQLGGTLQIDETGINVLDGTQQAQLLKTLTDDQCALVDDHGNVIFSAAGKGDDYGAGTSVLEAIRNYNWIQMFAREQLNMTLPSPRRCSIVKRRAPEDPATALMELGALGSFMEEPRLVHALPAMGCLEPQDLERVGSWAASLPPFYVAIGINVGLVRPET